MREIEQIIFGNYRLTTAEIIYHLPDHPSLLQTYLWQDMDVNPDFPVLLKFLRFWDREIEGKLHSVKIATCELIKPSEFRATHGIITIH